MKDKFNPSKYKQDFNKEHYKTFKADIKPELFEEITNYRNENKISCQQFLQKAINELKKEGI